MSLFGYYNNNNASVSFDRFCSVVRGRADLTPEYAVSQIASILNVSAGSSAMYALRGLLQSDSWLSDENLRPIYNKLYGVQPQASRPYQSSPWSSVSGVVEAERESEKGNAQPRTTYTSAPTEDFKNRLDLKSISFDAFAQAIRNVLAENKFTDVKVGHLLDMGLSAQLPHWRELTYCLFCGRSVDAALLQSLFCELTGRPAPSTPQPQSSHPCQSSPQSSVSGAVGGKASGFEQFCQVVRQYAHKKPDDSVRLIANALNVAQDNLAMKKLKKILSATRDPSDDELRPAYNLLNGPSGKAAQTRPAGKAGAQCVPNKKMNDTEATNFLGMTEVEF